MGYIPRDDRQALNAKCNRVVVGEPAAGLFLSVFGLIYCIIAQLVEQRAFNPQVEGQVPLDAGFFWRG